MFKYLLKLNISIGLLDNENRIFYSLEQFEELCIINNINLNKFGFAITPDIGYEFGIREKSINLRLDYPFTKIMELLVLCNFLNDVFMKIFDIMNQQRIHISYILSDKNGFVNSSILDLDKKNKRKVFPEDFLDMNGAYQKISTSNGKKLNILQMIKNLIFIFLNWQNLKN